MVRHALLVAPINSLTGIGLSDFLKKGKQIEQPPFQTHRWHVRSSFSEFELELPEEVRRLLDLPATATIGYIMAAASAKEILRHMQAQDIPGDIKFFVFCEETQALRDDHILFVNHDGKRTNYRVGHTTVTIS